MYRSNGKLYKADAIILSRKNHGESDRIITVFTKEYGKLRLIAKGIRKISSRRAPHLEIFSRVQLVMHQGYTMDSVSEVTSLYPGDKKLDLQEISIAYFYCELVNALLPEKQVHTDVYELLGGALESLVHGNIYAKSKDFTLTLLRILGFLEHDSPLRGEELQQFIENITQRKLRTPKLIRQVL